MKKYILPILSITLGITIIAEITYVSLSNSITDNQKKESIKSNLLTGLIYDDNGNKTEIFYTILNLTNLDEETVIKLMNNKKADKIITDIVDSIYDYNLTGDNSYKYTKTKIITIVEENIDEILGEINYNITEKQRQEILDIPYYEYGKGLTIGNVCSQILSIFYLSDIDHCIIHDLKCK